MPATSDADRRMLVHTHPIRQRRVPHPRAGSVGPCVLGLWIVLLLPVLLDAQVAVQWNVTTLAGNISGTVGSNNFGGADGYGTAASFRRPYGIAVASDGTFALVVRPADQ